MTILIDTNVILDILQKREPFFKDSYQALLQAIENDSKCLVSASAVTDIFYILRKSLGSIARAKEQLRQLSSLVTFADVKGLDLHIALMSDMPDFEDAVADAVAGRNGAEYILTCNIKDFNKSKVPAISPAEFLKLY